MAYKVDVKIYNPKRTVKRILSDKVGTFTAETWGKEFSKYVPMQEGNLDQTRQTEPFKVIYVQRYARRMHEGVTFRFSKERHKLAQAHWERAAFTESKDKVARAITKFIKSGDGG
jgi:hypothetical protein